MSNHHKLAHVPTCACSFVSVDSLRCNMRQDKGAYSVTQNDIICRSIPTQARRQGGGQGGGQLPPMVLPFLFLVSSVTYGDDDNTPTPSW